MRKVIATILLTTVAAILPAQKSKVQAAWRSLSDYEETLREGKPSAEYLTKAKEAIDAANANEDTRKQSRTQSYRLRIYYMLYQQKLAEEDQKLAATVTDKNERALKAYGNSSLEELSVANEALNTIKDVDPAYLETIQKALSKGTSGLDEEELKFAMAAQQMKVESANIAAGKYAVKKYAEAADFFFKTAMINSLLFRTKDTLDFYNACISAAKSGNQDLILGYNKKMIDAGLATAFNYESIAEVSLAKGDTAQALSTLKKGRAAFPDDAALLTQETNLFLASGRQQDALANLKLSIQKDPGNAVYYFIIGNIYDNMANPKDNQGRDLEKPANFMELFKNAESNYQKAIDLNPANKEYFYNAHYNLGAMYNNYGGTIANRKIEKITDLAKYQKENEAKAQEYYKLAIPHLEAALNVKPDDKVTMTALRKLYMLTSDPAKAKAMDERIKAIK
jgi:hypothetical protein